MYTQESYNDASTCRVKLNEKVECNYIFLARVHCHTGPLRTQHYYIRPELHRAVPATTKPSAVRAAGREGEAKTLPERQ